MFSKLKKDVLKMHKSLNRILKTVKEHNINASSGTHPAGYHKAGMKSLQRPQRAPSPPLPISMSYYEKPINVLQVTLPKSKSSKNFQILKDIPLITFIIGDFHCVSFCLG